MRLAPMLVGLSLLSLPATASATEVFLGWGTIVHSAQWIAAGTITHPTEDGFLFVTAEPLLGSPPAEQLITQRVNLRLKQSGEGLRIIAWRTTSGDMLWRGRRGNPEYSDSEWIRQVRFAVQNYARLEAATSPGERVEALRVLIASGLADSLFAVRQFWLEESAASGVDFHLLVPSLIQVIRTSRSASAVEDAVAILMPEARSEDLPELLGILERPDPAFQSKLLARIDRMTSPKPPPMELPATPAELGRAIEQRRAWYGAHAHELTWRGRHRKNAP